MIFLQSHRMLLYMLFSFQLGNEEKYCINTQLEKVLR